MSNFKKAFEKTIIFEGGYSDHPYDPGGKTKYGITESTARSHGYKGGSYTNKWQRRIS